MVFRVDYDKVSDVGRSLLTKSEDLRSLYYELIDICLEIDENWKSEDSSIYVGHMAAFIQDKIRENEKLYNTGSVLSKVSSLYGDQDKKWADDLMKSELMDKEKYRR